MSNTKTEHNCLKCDIIPCMNFYRPLNEAEGGEIFVFENTINHKLHVPCEIGSLIFALCKLTTPLDNFFGYDLFLQCIRDLKTSAFLLLCGHYRGAMQILRPVIENCLVGVYFDNKFLLTNDKKRVKKEYQKILQW